MRMLAALLLLCSPLMAIEPYDSVEVLPPYHQGWFNCRGQLKQIFDNRDIETVIEVGSWLGVSTIWMAENVVDGGKVYAVDHWKGSWEHQPGRYAYNEVLHRLYEQFLSNVIDKGMTERIVPVRMESGEAAAALDVKADLIYIDASHEFEPVLRDLEVWYPHLKEGGVFCGDDYNWRGVRRAVHLFARRHGMRIESDRAFWRLHPPKKGQQKGFAPWQIGCGRVAGEEGGE